MKVTEFLLTNLIMIFSLKTSMIKLKFKPDLDGAATALERASVCYRNAGDPKKASKALVDAASYYEQNGNQFHASK